MLKQIPDKYFEISGTGFGLLACASIAMQVVAEFRSDAPSTISIGYALGFLAVFLFWTLYGIRFRRAALWITNGVAVVMQLLLLIAIVV